MKILHNPVFNKDLVIKHYSEKDGVDIKYVCSTELSTDNLVVDIFYRDTPHPEFGNRYFGLYNSLYDGIMITNADSVEDYEFGMIGNDEMGWVYSQSRHDYRPHGSGAIDGGRAYVRRTGLGMPFKMMKVKDGEFIATEEE